MILIYVAAAVVDNHLGVKDVILRLLNLQDLKVGMTVQRNFW